MKRTVQRTDEEIVKIFSILKELFHDAKIELDYETPFQLLIAVVLSAQTTDRSVNKVTKDLFQTIKEPADLLQWDLPTLERAIASIGLYKTKALALLQLSTQILEKYNGQVPQDFDQLVQLRGVGRKTAHVVMNELFDYDVIAVDTHVFRVSHRLGLSLHAHRDDVGDELMAIIPKEYRKKAHHHLIFLGRRLCDAKKPKCADCPLKNLCTYGQSLQK